MELSEAYSFLFADSFMAMLVLPFQDYLAFTAMKTFGTYNNNLIVLLASLAVTLAACVNYAFGVAVFRFSKFKPSEDIWQKLTGLIKKYDYLLICACFLPYISPFLTLALGFMGARIKVFVPLIFIVNLIYFRILIGI